MRYVFDTSILSYPYSTIRQIQILAAFSSRVPRQVFSELGVHFYDFSLSVCALDSAELRFAHRGTARGECQTQPLEFADVFRAFYSVFPAFHCTAESAYVSNMNFSARAPLLVSSVSQSSTAAAARTDVSGNLSPTYVFGAWPPRALLKLWRPLASTVWLPSSLVLGKHPSDPIPASCDAECSVACELMDGSCA
jgi:hypothetical protein